MKALVDHRALFRLLLVFVIKIIGSNRIGDTLSLPKQLSLFVPFNGLEEEYFVYVRVNIMKMNHFSSLTVNHELKPMQDIVAYFEIAHIMERLFKVADVVPQ